MPRTRQRRKQLTPALDFNFVPRQSSPPTAPPDPNHLLSPPKSPPNNPCESTTSPPPPPVPIKRRPQTDSAPEPSKRKWPNHPLPPPLLPTRSCRPRKIHSTLDPKRVPNFCPSGLTSAGPDHDDHHSPRKQNSDHDNPPMPHIDHAKHQTRLTRSEIPPLVDLDNSADQQIIPSQGPLAHGFSAPSTDPSRPGTALHDLLGLVIPANPLVAIPAIPSPPTPTPVPSDSNPLLSSTVRAPSTMPPTSPVPSCPSPLSPNLPLASTLSDAAMKSILEEQGVPMSSLRQSALQAQYGLLIARQQKQTAPAKRKGRASDSENNSPHSNGSNSSISRDPSTLPAQHRNFLIKKRRRIVDNSPDDDSNRKFCIPSPLPNTTNQYNDTPQPDTLNRTIRTAHNGIPYCTSTPNSDQPTERAASGSRPSRPTNLQEDTESTGLPQFRQDNTESPDHQLLDLTSKQLVDALHSCGAEVLVASSKIVTAVQTIAEEVRDIKESIHHVVSRPSGGDKRIRRSTKQQTPVQSGRLSALIRLHVQTLFGSCMETASSSLGTDVSDIGSDSDVDPSFPYGPEGPGHKHATHETLVIIWRGMRFTTYVKGRLRRKYRQDNGWSTEQQEAHAQRLRQVTRLTDLKKKQVAFLKANSRISVMNPEVAASKNQRKKFAILWLPWRHPCMDAIMEQIDWLMNEGSTNTCKKACRPNRQRIRIKTPTDSQAEPARQLPGNCYNPKWIGILEACDVKSLKCKGPVDLTTYLQMLEQM
ncbi:hypothetical protein PCASD_14737 [Puccinia coronata f. sp. avenae]|uniref:Uncharacterized protein n=1 Tax=Puccinia coronata f. sp. avenae TaxID=200324 RepID=A0A2N5TD29_9BASI|nr:hypothetical protein PCASD_14737 [Puccinia coronata f. sp. avenae]